MKTILQIALIVDGKSQAYRKCPFNVPKTRNLEKGEEIDVVGSTLKDTEIVTTITHIRYTTEGDIVYYTEGKSLTAEQAKCFVDGEDGWKAHGEPIEVTGEEPVDLKGESSSWFSSN